tara:strand:- start:479 stop:946 length:468 start_codon:yes stop_codon:yes gene_type:complete
MQPVPPATTVQHQAPVAQQMPVSQNQQMQAAYNQQMGYQTPVQSASVTPVANTVQPNWKIKMADKGLFFTKVAALLITVLTLGIAKPWGDTMIIRKWASNLSIDGRSVTYNGTAIELFGIWIKVLLLTVITIGIYYLFWGRYAVDRYIDSRLSWA